METLFDIGIARNVHLRWELALESMARGNRDAVDLQSYETCELGLWLHKTGVQKYHDIDAIHQLVTIHRKFHTIADSIVFNLQNSNWAAVEEKLKEVRATSREIVFMLTVVEFSFLERQKKFKNLPNPIRNLLVRLFDQPEQSSHEEDPTLLEASHARLTHFQWSRDLLRAFRDREVTLTPSETCPLGVWIHSVGLQQHKELADIQKLDLAHKAFHVKAQQAVNALRRKNNHQADVAYNETLRLSQDVVYLLSTIEYQLQSSNSIAPRITIMG